MLLYPTTLVTRFIPAYFTGGYLHGFNTSKATSHNLKLAPLASTPKVRNQVGISTQGVRYVGGVVEDTKKGG